MEVSLQSSPCVSLIGASVLRMADSSSTLPPGASAPSFVCSCSFTCWDFSACLLFTTGSKKRPDERNILRSPDLRLPRAAVDASVRARGRILRHLVALEGSAYRATRPMTTLNSLHPSSRRLAPILGKRLCALSCTSRWGPSRSAVCTLYSQTLRLSSPSGARSQQCSYPSWSRCRGWCLRRAS